MRKKKPQAKKHKAVKKTAKLKIKEDDDDIIIKKPSSSEDVHDLEDLASLEEVEKMESPEEEFEDDFEPPDQDRY